MDTKNQILLSYFFKLKYVPNYFVELGWGPQWNGKCIQFFGFIVFHHSQIIKTFRILFLKCLNLHLYILVFVFLYEASNVTDRLTVLNTFYTNLTVSDELSYLATK